MNDPEVLAPAAGRQRVILIPQGRDVGTAIDELPLIWLASKASE
jgi:hypothetical protein